MMAVAIEALSGTGAGCTDACRAVKYVDPETARWRLGLLHAHELLCAGCGGAADAPYPQPAEVDGLMIDFAQRVARLDGARLALTEQEWRLLAALGRRPGEWVAAEAIWREMRPGWPYDGGDSTRGDRHVIRVHLARLRRKIGGYRIETLWNRSMYRLATGAEPRP